MNKKIFLITLIFTVLLGTNFIFVSKVEAKYCGPNSHWLNITSPSNGQVFSSSESISISWEKCNIPETNNIKLMLYKVDSNMNVLSTKNLGIHPNNGHESITLPIVEEAGIYVFGIKDKNNNKDLSQKFTIKPIDGTQNITISTPNGGEVFSVGDTMTIKWDSQNIENNVYVQVRIRDERYSTENEAGDAVIDNVLNTGSYTWTIPQSLGELSMGQIGGENVYKILVTTDSAYDDSDVSFSINAENNSVCSPDSTPSITIISPNGEEIFTAGESVSVNWLSCNIPENAEIQIGMQWPFQALDLPITVVNNSGSASYTFQPESFFEQNDLQFGQYYKLVLTAPYITVDDISVYDSSDNWFTINQ